MVKIILLFTLLALASNVTANQYGSFPDNIGHIDSDYNDSDNEEEDYDPPKEDDDLTYEEREELCDQAGTTDELENCLGDF